MSVENALAYYLSQPDVESAEPNIIYRPLGVLPSDPMVSLQSSLSNINAPGGWEFEKGLSPNVTVAVIDTGVDNSHPDLPAASKLLTAYARHFPNSGPDDGSYNDICGHGTMVAGVASAATDNGVGIAGVSWGAKILPIRVFDDCNGTDETTIVKAVNYVVAKATTNPTDFGRVVINLSLGSTSTVSGALSDSIQSALNNNVVVVAAAGNADPANGIGYDVQFPAKFSGVIAVGATDSSDSRASFSTRGPELSVTAPGVSVLSTAKGGGYSNGTGTSFSAPHAAGLAALILSADPSASTASVRSIMEQTADDLGSPGRDDDYGAGRINVFKAMRLVKRGTLSDFKGESEVTAFPNPFRFSSHRIVSFAVPPSLQGSDLEIRIYTMGGELVRTLKGLTWDATNDAGRRVASGVYLFRVRTDRGHSQGRLAVIK